MAPWRLAPGSVLAAAIMCGPAAARAERVVFLNAGAVNINTANGQEPTLDSYNTTGFVAGPLSGWPALTEDDQARLVYLMKEATVALDVRYTWERPASGTYDMLVMGTAADNNARFPTLGCSAAIGLADCDDGNVENISFLFWGCMTDAQQTNLDQVAHTMFSSLGFGWGLENTSAAGQLMGSFFDNGQSIAFSTVCAPISGAPNCTHPGCAPGEQNATSELSMRLGVRVDDGPAQVVITEPLPGSTLGSDFTIAADVDDLFGGLTVEMTIVEAMVSEADDEPPYAWSVAGVPEGPWTFRVDVTDADGNLTTQQVSVCVGSCDGGSGTDTGGSDTEALDTSGDGGPGQSTGVADAASSSDDGGGDTGPVDPTIPGAVTTFGQDGADTGCTCRAAAAPRGSGPGPWLMLCAIVLARRRRRR